MGILSSLFGGGKQRQDPATVFGPQVGPLSQLFGQAGGLANQQLGQVGPFAQQLSGQLGQQGQDFLGGLGQGAGQQLNQFMGPGFANQQLGALNQFSLQNLRGALGQVDQNAIGSGGFGGTAQGLAQGEAIGQANTAFNLAGAGILQNDLARQQQAATAQAGLQAQSGLGGLGQLGGLFDLGLSGFSAAFNPLLQAGAVIGQPTVLGGGGQQKNQGGIIPGLSGMFSPIKL